MLKMKTLVQTMMALGLVSVASGAMASYKIYTGPEATPDQVVAINPTGLTTIDGNAYLNGHFSVNEKQQLQINGSLLKATNQTVNQHDPNLYMGTGTQVTIKDNADLYFLKFQGDLSVGGTLALNQLEITQDAGSLTYGQLIVKDQIYNSQTSKLKLDNLTFTGNFFNQGGDVELSGKIGTEEKAATLNVQSKHKITVNGDAILNGVHATNNGSVDIQGTLYGSESAWTSLVGDGTSTLHANDVVMHNGTVAGLRLKANSLTINGSKDGENRGTFTITNVDSVGNAHEGQIDVDRLVLNGNLQVQHHSKTEPLKVSTVVLNVTEASDNYLQSQAPMDFGEVVVQSHGRLYGYSDDASLKVGTVTVADGGSFGLTSKFNNVGQIDSMVLGKDTLLTNGEDKDGGRRGFHTTVTNVTGENVSVINEHGTLKLGTETGSVNLSGVINDKKDGVTLTLNQKSHFTLTGQSKVGTVAMMGGTTDISKTDDNLTISNLTGSSGTVIMDAAKTNSVEVAKTDVKSSIEVKASENADKVTTDQATTMVQRLEGVTNKTGRVDEGMYQGAITVDKTGHATQAKNDLMADTLELASASTLSLNRILMNDVRKRLGDIRSLEATNGVWARYDGGKLSGEGTTNKFNTLHIGGDMAPFADNSMRLGVSASYTKGDVDYTRGSSDLDAYSLAAYGTWMADNGLFADVIARVAKAKSDMKVDGTYKGDLNNTAYSLSGEMGWRFDFNDMFYAEPQMEATYTYIDSDKMTLSGNGEAYHYAVDSFDSLIGRVGVLAGMKCPAQKGDLYVRASMVHEFLGDATINGGNMAKIENDGKDTWVEYGVGANFNIMKNAYIWADIERTAGANVDEDWRGTVGVRYAF